MKNKVYIYLVLLLFITQYPSCNDFFKNDYYSQAVVKFWYDFFPLGEKGFLFESGDVQVIQDSFNPLLSLYNLQAVMLYKDNETGKALESLNKSIEVNPDYYQSYFIRSCIYIEKEMYDQALLDYIQLISFFPGIPSYYYNRALLYKYLNNIEQSITDFEKVLELDPGYKPVVLQLAQLYSLKADYEKSNNYYNKALEYDPKNSTLYLSRGLTLFHLKKYEQAAADFSVVIEKEPDIILSKDAWYYRAFCFRINKKYEQALADLVQIKNLFDNECAFHMMLADTMFSLNQIQPAREEFAKAIALDPNYLDMYLESTPANNSYYNESFIKSFFFSPKHKFQLLLIGDSMAGGALRFGITNNTQTYTSVEFTYEYKVSSGLTNIAFYDWQAVAGEILKKKRFDLIMVILGTNDGQGLMDNYTPHGFGTAGWINVYKQRIKKFIAMLSANAQKVYWMGMPPMYDPPFNERMKLLNSIYEESCKDQANTIYVSLFKILGDKNGAYQIYIEEAGQLTTTRYSDHVHFTMAGIKPLVDFLMQNILLEFNLY